MLLKIIGLIFITKTSIQISESLHVVELNETKSFEFISNQLSELRAELSRQGNLFDSLSVLPDQENSKSYPRNCAEVKTSGIHKLFIPSYSKHPFSVVCDADTHGGGWTTLLSRYDGSENFYRTWNAYKTGFGYLDGEFFLGLNKIRALTSDQSMVLLVVLEDFEGDIRYETYEKFGISGEQEHFALNTLGKANGTAGDSLAEQHGMKFSTYDRDNDRHSKSCAELYTGAWWYSNCHNSNLAGKYGNNENGKGINWLTFRGLQYSLKRVVMMVRPNK